MSLLLTGDSLTVDDLARVARDRTLAVALDAAAMVRVRRANARILRALADAEPVYGLTTGLGSRATEPLTTAEAARFSMDTLRGRAHATGEPLPVADVRAAMVVRLNTLLRGAAGADVAVLHKLSASINAGLTPVVGGLGSIGAGDLCLGATLGLALAGEGDIQLADGRRLPADEALATGGISPLTPGPRDGLALANHSSFSAAAMALGVWDAGVLYRAIQVAGAVSMAAFGANTSPLDSVVDRVRPQPGQRAAAAMLRDLLAGSPLLDPVNARRLQDPLSIRNLPQVHGAVLAALETAELAAGCEINGASDNPLVDPEGDRILSGGAYHTPHLTVTAQALSQAWIQAAFAQLARMSKLLSARFSGLPQYLAPPGSTGNGFAPLMKIAESVVAEMAHAAMPVPLWPSINADGVEDIQSNAPTAIRGLREVIDLGFRLTAMELIVASHGLGLRDGDCGAPRITEAATRVRGVVGVADGASPLGKAIEVLARRIGQGLLENCNNNESPCP